MNFKRLIKFFPEIHSLTPAQQESLLIQAQQSIQQNTSKPRLMLINLLSGAVVCGLCLATIWHLGPMLGLPPALAAIGVMVIILPIYMARQRRLYIRNLRTHLQKIGP